MVLGALTWTRASLTKWRATPPLTGRPIKRSTLTPRKWSHRGLRRTGAPKQPLLHTKPYPSKAPISSRHKQNVSKPNKKQKGQSKAKSTKAQTNKQTFLRFFSCVHNFFFDYADAHTNKGTHTKVYIQTYKKKPKVPKNDTVLKRLAINKQIESSS